MLEFEQKVLQGLISCGVKSGSKIGLAVSGGADSISLLRSVFELARTSQINVNPQIYVITVNHNIRPAEECGGDAEFVRTFCENLNNMAFTDDNPAAHYGSASRAVTVNCTVVELPRGQVDITATERCQGIEDAARTLRYQAFEQFIEEHNLDFLCLAHNQNDQLETILMRFLGGGAAETLAGIKAVRGKYIRPMLDISRAEIEAYIGKCGCSFRTDLSNADTAYMRNRIRVKLIPFLNETFGNWQASVLSGAKRVLTDSEVISSMVDGVELRETEGGVCVQIEGLPVAVKERILLKACSAAGETMRVPLAFIDEFLRQYAGGKNVNLQFHNVEICAKNNSIFVRKSVKTHTQMVFSAIIEDKGTYELPFGELVISDSGEAVINGQIAAGGIELPCCIRSAQPGDEIKSADGKMKKVSDIFSDWHVPVELRCCIPVLQKLSGKNQELTGIFGGVYGFNNWVVK